MELSASSAQHVLTERQRRLRWTLIVLIALGFAARIGILLISRGSIDAVLWEKFASQIVTIGLYDTYRFEPWMNHPPLPALFAAWVYRFSQFSGLPFPLLFKIPQVLADGVACLLLYKIYHGRQGAAPLAGLIAAALFSWNLDALLLSAFHCNTDSSYSMLCIAALWLAVSKQMPLLAGLALGAAMNIKLLPGLFVLPILLLSRSWREVFRLFFGLAITTIPFDWMLYDLGYRFRQRVLRYNPSGGWGFTELLDSLRSHPHLRKYSQGVIDRYTQVAKPLVLMCTALPALSMRQRGDWDRYRAVALASGVFVVVTPAFAIQYGAMVGLALLAYDLTAGAVWGMLAGLRVLSFYIFLWNGTFPIAAVDPQGGEGPHRFLGILCWGWAIYWLVGQQRAATPATLSES